jgi:hypothetical protein
MKIENEIKKIVMKLTEFMKFLEITSILEVLLSCQSLMIALKPMNVNALKISGRYFRDFSRLFETFRDFLRLFETFRDFSKVLSIGIESHFETRKVSKIFLMHFSTTILTLNVYHSLDLKE